MVEDQDTYGLQLKYEWPKYQRYQQLRHPTSKTIQEGGIFVLIIRSEQENGHSRIV
jgi:hypothetical protein